MLQQPCHPGMILHGRNQDGTAGARQCDPRAIERHVAVGRHQMLYWQQAD
jgi:hypothetical protein